MTSGTSGATGGVPQVVFACVRNGGRSVISRVLAEHYAQGRVRAVSAGTQPGEHVHPEVAAVLERLGLDRGEGAHPHHLRVRGVRGGVGPEVDRIGDVTDVDRALRGPVARHRMIDAGVDKAYRGRDKASDHAPTWVRLR